MDAASPWLKPVQKWLQKIKCVEWEVCCTGGILLNSLGLQQLIRYPRSRRCGRRTCLSWCDVLRSPNSCRNLLSWSSPELKLRRPVLSWPVTLMSFLVFQPWLIWEVFSFEVFAPNLAREEHSGMSTKQAMFRCVYRQTEEVASWGAMSDDFNFNYSLSISFHVYTGLSGLWKTWKNLEKSGNFFWSG